VKPVTVLVEPGEIDLLGFNRVLALCNVDNYAEARVVIWTDIIVKGSCVYHRHICHITGTKQIY
jgi:hypothetical protein